MGVYLVLNLALSCRYDVIKPAVGGLEVKRTFYIGSEILIAPTPWESFNAGEENL